jgi:hypothetical protein
LGLVGMGLVMDFAGRLAGVGSWGAQRVVIDDGLARVGLGGDGRGAGGGALLDGVGTVERCAETKLAPALLDQAFEQGG